MAVAALFAWLLTAGLGLYMFAIWLIEDDGSIDGKATAGYGPRSCSAMPGWPLLGFVSGL